MRVAVVARERLDPLEAGEALVVERELPLPDPRVRLDPVELDERDRREHVREVRLEPRADLVVERPVATPRQPHVPDRRRRRRRGSSRRALPRRRRCSSSRRARSRRRPRCRRPCGRGTCSRPRARRPRRPGSPSARIGSRSAGCPARCTGMIAFVRSVTRAGISAGSMLRSLVADVAEDGSGAAVLDHVRRRGPGDRARDHLVARADADREQRQVERRRARR